MCLVSLCLSFVLWSIHHGDDTKQTMTVDGIVMMYGAISVEVPIIPRTVTTIWDIPQIIMKIIIHHHMPNQRVLMTAGIEIPDWRR